MTSETIAQKPDDAGLLERQLFMLLVLGAMLLITMQSAYATNTPMGSVLCSIASMMYGNLGKGLATLAVVILGIGATLGKTSWGLAMTVAVGISVIFNASPIVGYLGSNAGGC